MNGLQKLEPTSTAISAWTNQQLRDELARQLTLTAEALLRASELWTELQRRGVDMNAFRSGLGFYLPRIARKELAAEAVVTFAGQRTLLQALIGMPLEEQRRYASGEPIAILEPDDKGTLTARERRLNELSRREITLVLTDGRVRSTTEQRQSISRIQEKPSRMRKSTGSVVTIRAEAGLLHVGRSRLDPLDLAPALRALGYDLVQRGS